MTTETVRPDSIRAWLLAARPKTLTAALIPVMAACMLAYADGVFQSRAAMLCVLFAALMQIAANLINDLFDFRKGTDRADRLGPERACAQGWITPRAMERGIALTVGAACLAGYGLLLYGGWELILIGASCVVFAFLYTTLLSYCGLGDLLVFVFFGWVPVCGTYYVQAHTLTPAVCWAAAACGIVVDTLLVLNNYRDRDTDRRTGKRTLIVLLGEPFGRYFYAALGLAGCLCCLGLAGRGPYSLGAWLPWLYLLPHSLTWRHMVRIGSGKALNAILGETSRNMFLFALLLCLGLWLDTL